MLVEIFKTTTIGHVLLLYAVWVQACAWAWASLLGLDLNMSVPNGRGLSLCLSWVQERNGFTFAGHAQSNHLYNAAHLHINHQNLYEARSMVTFFLHDQN